MRVRSIPDDLIFDVNEVNYSAHNAAQKLSEYGVIIMRNTTSTEIQAEARDRINKVLDSPNISGSYGYYQKDPHKKMFPGFLLGRSVIDIVANETVLDVVDQVLGAESLLAEVYMKQDLGVNRVYFPLHADFSVDSHAAGVDITDDLMAKPFAIGGMYYLNDTIDGAFCYALGTHKSEFREGLRQTKRMLHMYSDGFKRKVKEQLVRVEGKAGDIAIYDDRAFHGPDQPVSIERTVIIWDHFSTEIFGRIQKGPTPVLTTDLHHLSERQLRFIGVGSDLLVDLDDYHVNSFKRHWGYRWVSRLQRAMFDLTLARYRIGDFVKRRRRLHATWDD